MNSLPSHDELASWLSEKKYLSENCYDADSAWAMGKIINGTLSTRQERALIKHTQSPPSGSIVYKYGKRSFVGACPIADTTLALKYYHRLSPRRQLGYTMFGSHAMKAWIGSRVFHKLGIPTPQPVALFESRRFGFLADTSLLATEVIGGTPLADYVDLHSSDMEKMSELKAHCQSMFDCLAKYRICHRDTAARNFIVKTDGSLWVIDLDAVEILTPPAVWKKRRAKDKEKFMRIFVNNPQLAPLFGDVFSHD